MTFLGFSLDALLTAFPPRAQLLHEKLTYAIPFTDSRKLEINRLLYLDIDQMTLCSMLIGRREEKIDLLIYLIVLFSKRMKDDFC